MYQKPFIKITAIGDLLNSDEIFAFSFNVGSSSVVPISYSEFEGLDPHLAPIATQIGDAFSATDGLVPSNYRLLAIKAALIGTDGKYIGAPLEYVFSTPVGGGNAFLAYAPQLANAVTLVSSKFKDPGKYNRFYVPSVGTGESGGRLTEAQREGLLNNWAVAMSSINLELHEWDLNYNVAVLSNSGAGYQQLAVNVRVGRVIDTQRRRRNKLVEDYQVAPIDII